VVDKRKGERYMAIDGTYRIIMQTSEGEMPSTFEFKTNGTELSGTVTDQFGTFNIEDGLIDGITFKFSIEAEGPVGGAVHMEFEGSIEGDRISGEIEHVFGSATFAGKRA
jgi:hypothetical protein